MHSPRLYKDVLIFISKDDLWSSDISGKNPRRLTHGLGIIRNPCISPDGNYIAFSATSEGAQEIYIIPTQGGDANRLTFLGQQAQACTWKDNKHIIFSSHHDSPFRENSLYNINIDSHTISLIKVGHANNISYNNSDEAVIQRYGYGYTSLKRYQGGLAGQLWIQKKQENFKLLINKKHNLIAPIWHQQRIYFLSDYQDHGNVYSCDLDGNDLQRHTHHEDFYVQSFHIEQKHMVYAKAGKLFHLNLENNIDQLIPIEQGSTHNPQYQRKFASNNLRLEAAMISPDAQHIAISNRGRLFYMPTWQGGAYHLANKPQLRFKELDYAYDNKLLASCDHGKHDSLYLFDDTAPHDYTCIDKLDLGRILHLKTSPNGLHALISNHRHELLLLDIKNKKLIPIDQSSYNSIHYFDWAPDSKWLVYSIANSHETAQIKLYQLSSKKITDLTQGQYPDYAPCFDTQGKYIFFISQRHYEAQMDELLFQYGYKNTSKIYLICLQKNTSSPFLHLPKAEQKTEKKKKEDSQDEDTSKPPKDIQIDLEGISMRTTCFPIPAGKYTLLLPIEEKLLILDNCISEAEDEEEQEYGKLSVYNFKELHFETLIEGISSAALSKDRKSLLYYHEQKLRVIEAGTKPDNSDNSYKNGGWIDIERARVEISPEQEWPFIFTEAWRLQRDFYWDKDMGGIDWDAIYEQYLPLAKQARTRSELNEVISEMQGELGCSHAYTWGGEMPKQNRYPIGQLGCNFSYDKKKNHYTITAIYSGEYGDNYYSSPLLQPDVNIQEGDSIIAVNGQTVDANTPPEKLLIHQSNRYVILSIQPKDPKLPICHKHVKTLSSTKPLLYRRWVERNKAYVAEKSNGKFGYIHIPDMSRNGLTEFYRNYHQCYDKDALIIDVRYNGGGHVSSMILQKLAIARFGLDFTRWHGAAFSYPHAAPRGNMVALCNENTGSDGDIFSYAFKKLQLGKLIGTRTWGGVVGINVRNQLLDGGVTTQPEYAVWFQEAGYSIENYGVDPDEVVTITPEQAAIKADPQLDQAIAELSNLQKSKQPALEHTVNQTSKPSRKAKKLPELAC